MGFRHILFPVDFSPRSYGAVPFVRALAARYRAAVTLVHVVEPPPTWVGIDGGYAVEPDMASLKSHAEQQLATFAMDEFPHLSVTRMVEEGDPGGCISDLAHSWHVDLIMMPIHGAGRIREALLGSVTAKVLSDSPCPVWTAAHPESTAPRAPGEIRSLLCAIDLSPESRALIRAAESLGARTALPRPWGHTSCGR